VEPLKKRVFKRGAYIYIEGDEEIDEIFIVEKGHVELKAVNEGIKRYKSVVTDGEVFGLISSLCKRPRMESAIAISDSVIVAATRDKFMDLVQKSPDIAIKIIRNFADELRLYDDMMFSLTAEGTDVMQGDLKFFSLGEYYHRHGFKQYAFYILKTYLKLFPNGIKIDDAKNIIGEIEQTGLKALPEPVKRGVYKIFGDQQIIFAENEPGEELYIIKEGKVKIVKFSNDTEIILSVLREGDIFGDLAIVSNKPRNASAISWGKTALLPIRKETLTMVLAKSPGIIYKIFMAISQRIWFTYIKLEARVYKKPITRIYALIENNLLEHNISLKSTKPEVINFGIDELIRMTGLPQSLKEKTMDVLLGDSNLEFRIGQILVDNPNALSTRAKFYRSRDHIISSADKENMLKKERPGTKAASIVEDEEPVLDEPDNENKPEEHMEIVDAGGEKDEDLKVPSQEINFDFD
jgi:CRP-like cAMP-binding protein